MNKDFLTGFAVGAEICDPIELSRAYYAWFASTGMNPVEEIDLQGGGYETGLEAGKLYREQQQTNN